MRGLYLDSTFAPGATAIDSPGNRALSAQWGQPVVGMTGGGTAMDAASAAGNTSLMGGASKGPSMGQQMGGQMLLQGISDVGKGLSAADLAKGMKRQKGVTDVPEGYVPVLANFAPVALQGA